MTKKCAHTDYERRVDESYNGCILCDNEVLRGNLTLAEEGLANYAKEVELLRDQRDTNLAKEVERIASLTTQRDEYKVLWERDSTALGKALNEVSSLRAGKEQFRAAIEQLHAAVKTAQELAARRLMEIDRLHACWSEALGNVTVRNQEIEQLRAQLQQVVAIGFEAGVEAQKRSHEPSEVRPLSEWHEDDGPAVWWKFPVEEAAWIGGPNDSDWPGYHTHWTPHPPVPEQRLRTTQGESALTHVDGLPSTREPVSQQPHGTAGESPALFNCGYDPTSHGWVIREGSREGVLVACFLREEDANSYVIPAYALKSETVKDSCGPGCAMGANRPAQKSDEIRDLACCDVFTRESASEFCATCGYTNLDHLRRRANNGSKQS